MAPVVEAMLPRLFGPGADRRSSRASPEQARARPAGAAAALRGRARRPDYRRALAALDLPGARLHRRVRRRVVQRADAPARRAARRAPGGPGVGGYALTPLATDLVTSLGPGAAGPSAGPRRASAPRARAR